MFDYSVFITHPGHTLAYSLLLLSILSFWIANRKVAFVILATAKIIAAFVGVINIYGVLILSFTGLWCYFNEKHRFYSAANKLISYTAALIVVFLIYKHQLIGFFNWQLGKKFYLNYDKAAMGAILALVAVNFINKKREFYKIIKPTLLVTAIAIVIVLFLPFTLGFIKFDLSIDSFYIIWAINNLFFVAFAEEVLFRGVIQRRLQQKFKSKKGQQFAIILAAFLFGFVLHSPNSFEYLLFATIAGYFYGLAYYLTKRIEASILTHFLLNTCHYVVFNYPVLY